MESSHWRMINADNAIVECWKGGQGVDRRGQAGRSFGLGAGRGVGSVDRPGPHGDRQLLTGLSGDPVDQRRSVQQLDAAHAAHFRGCRLARLLVRNRQHFSRIRR